MTTTEMSQPVVWVVMDNVGSSWELLRDPLAVILGVYSSREQAEAAIAAIPPDPHGYNRSLLVESLPLDAPALQPTTV